MKSLPPPSSATDAFLFFGSLFAPLIVPIAILYVGFAVVAFFQDVPTEAIWAKFWGKSVNFNSFFNWVDFELLKRVWDFHWERMTSWPWIRYYWNWGMWIAVAFSVISFFPVTIWSLRTLFSTPKTQARDLSSKDSAKGLIQRGVKKEAGIFGGRYNNQDLYISLKDRGLVIGPPQTGKTSFLTNQILKASESRLSFIAIDIKPELTDILSGHLQKSGYRVLCLDPLSDESDHYNPLDDIDNEPAINELVVMPQEILP